MKDEYVDKEMLVKATGRDKTTITDELVDSINALLYDEPEVGKLIKDSFINYTHVLKDGKYSMEEYLNAVKFVSFKLMNLTNQEAYIKTYPARYKELEHRYITIEGMEEKDFNRKVSSYVYAVAKSKLVTDLLTQSQVPTKLLNLGLLQEAINVEAELMYNARSEMVREKAASTLISYLGVEEKDTSIQIDIGIKKDERIDQYEKLFLNMAEAQLTGIKNGGDVKELTNITVVDVEATNG